MFETTMKIRIVLLAIAALLIVACSDNALEMGGAYYSADDLDLNEGDNYEPVGTNPFVLASHDPFSTFAADVDTASYDLFRRGVGILAQRFDRRQANVDIGVRCGVNQIHESATCDFGLVLREPRGKFGQQPKSPSGCFPNGWSRVSKRDAQNSDRGVDFPVGGRRCFLKPVTQRGVPGLD